VPDVRGAPASDATSRLKALGFEVRHSAGPAATTAAEAFTIAAQDPEPGTPLPPGSAVSLRVRGGFVSTAGVPSLDGRPRADAEAALRAAGLVPQFTDAGSPPGADRAHTVARQFPEPGAVVEPGALVSVAVYGTWVAPTAAPTVAPPAITDVLGWLARDVCPAQLRIAPFVVDPTSGIGRPGPASDLQRVKVYELPYSRPGSRTWACGYRGQFETHTATIVFAVKPGAGCGHISPTTEYPPHQKYWSSPTHRFDLNVGQNGVFAERDALAARLIDAVEKSGIAPRCEESR
jgi:hypothetical protein